jgi:hypothetical protein
MNSRFLPVFYSNAQQEISDYLAVADRDPSPGTFRGLCRGFRARGCSAFFLSCDPAALHQDLQRSGAAFAHFLRGASDADKVTSRADAFFDAIASGDRAIATTIAMLASTKPKLDAELLDDFHYVRLLMSRFFGNASEAELARTLADFEAALEGTPTPAFEVCKALLAADSDAFRQALGGLIAAHKAFYTKGVSTGRVSEEDWAINGCIFIEGLALVRLAAWAGMATEPEYPLIPSVALMDTPLPSDPNIWRRI